MGIEDQSVFKELQDKSKELSKHNAELAGRLKQNQEMIERFNSTMARLKEDVGTKVAGEEDLLRQIQDHLSTIKSLDSQLQEKGRMINNLHDSLQHTREQIVDDFEGRLSSFEAQLQSKTEMIRAFKEQVDRKDAFIVKLNTLVEQLNKRITAESDLVHTLKKDNLALLKNKHAIQQERVQLTNSLKTAQERIKVAERMSKEVLKRMITSEERAKLVRSASENMKKQYLGKIKAVELMAAVSRKDHATRLKSSIESGTKKQVALKAENEYLKKQITLHKKLLAEREDRERKFVEEFNARFKEVLSVRSQVEIKPAKEAAPTDAHAVVVDVTEKKTGRDKTEREHLAPHKKATDTDIGSFSFEKGKEIELEHVETEPEQAPPPGIAVIHHGMEGPDMSILEPLIERAFESGETRDQVKASMLHSGYPEDEIDKVFDRLEII